MFRFGLNAIPLLPAMIVLTSFSLYLPSGLK